VHLIGFTIEISYGACPYERKICTGIGLPVLNFGARRGECSSSRRRRLPPENLPGTHCIGGWVGLGTGLYGFRKSRPYGGSNSELIDHIGIRCIDCAIRTRQSHAQ